MHCVSHAIRRALDAALAARVSPELTGTRGLVLGYIARHTGAGQAVYQRDLEEHFRIRRSSVTALLKAMEQDGFITRTVAKQDARLKSLTLTPKGRACHEAIGLCIADCEASLRSGLEPAQLKELCDTLDQLLCNARALQAAPKP